MSAFDADYEYALKLQQQEDAGFVSDEDQHPGCASPIDLTADEPGVTVEAAHHKKSERSPAPHVRPHGPVDTKATPLFYQNRLPNVAPIANVDSVSLSSLFETTSESGKILETYLFNYLIDLEFLHQAVPQLAVSCGAVHLIANDLNVAEVRRYFSTAVVHSPPLPVAYGTHHTKLIILVCERALRVCILTANLRHSDWFGMNQLIFKQDFVALPQPTSCDSQFYFGADLCEYFSHYPSWLVPLISRIRCTQSGQFLYRYDFSNCAALLVASVPGYHRGPDLFKFGHMRVRKLMHHFGDSEANLAKFRQAPLTCQFSSIGSLDSDWLFEEFNTSLSLGAKASAVHCIWPRVDDVRNSSQGYASGGSLPCTTKNMKPFLRSSLHLWEGVNQRGSAMPHLKTYTRALPSGELQFLLMTSCNLSKAAWGELQKKDSQLCIRSWELGVLLLPSRCAALSAAASVSEPRAVFTLGKRKSLDDSPPAVQFFCSRQALARSVASEPRSERSPSTHLICPLPYEPLSKQYSDRDAPWVWDGIFQQPDNFGCVWPRLL